MFLIPVLRPRKEKKRKPPAKSNAKTNKIFLQPHPYTKAGILPCKIDSYVVVYFITYGRHARAVLDCKSCSSFTTFDGTSGSGC